MGRAVGRGRAHEVHPFGACWCLALRVGARWCALVRGTPNPHAVSGFRVREGQSVAKRRVERHHFAPRSPKRTQKASNSISPRTLSWWHAPAHVVGISESNYVLATSRCLEWRYDRQRTSTSSSLRSPGYQGQLLHEAVPECVTHLRSDAPRAGLRCKEDWCAHRCCGWPRPSPQE